MFSDCPEEGIAYTWKGSIVSSNRDGTGMLYRWNRYYDPVTGRFTQVDPIGLAGGVNVYGFAEGDPVNFSDPFGLNPCLIPPVAVVCGEVIITGGALVAAIVVQARRELAEGAQALWDAGSDLAAGVFAAVSKKVLEVQAQGGVS